MRRHIAWEANISMEFNVAAIRKRGFPNFVRMGVIVGQETFYQSFASDQVKSAYRRVDCCFVSCIECFFVLEHRANPRSQVSRSSLDTVEL